MTDSVRVLIFEETNKETFLVLSEKDDPTNVKLPGGKFEGAETPQQAVIRELFEELGIKVDVSNLNKVAELVNDDGLSKRFIFQVKIDKNLISPSDEIDHVEWVTKETVPEGKNKGHILAALEACKSEE